MLYSDTMLFHSYVREKENTTKQNLLDYKNKIGGSRRKRGGIGNLDKEWK